MHNPIWWIESIDNKNWECFFKERDWGRKRQKLSALHSQPFFLSFSKCSEYAWIEENHLRPVHMSTKKEVGRAFWAMEMNFWETLLLELFLENLWYTASRVLEHRSDKCSLFVRATRQRPEFEHDNLVEQRQRPIPFGNSSEFFRNIGLARVELKCYLKDESRGKKLLFKSSPYNIARWLNFKTVTISIFIPINPWSRSPLL